MRALALMIGALGLLLVRPPTAEACAPAPPPGIDVAILAEEAVIIWDEVAKRQHFIRRADFRTEATAFGFIVPTPSVPELAEASAELFSTLDRLTRPRVVTEREWRGIEPTCLLLATFSAPDKAGAAPGGVRVLKHEAVAGYDAVVLEASDPAALSKWLADNDYAETDTLTEWAAPYVAKGWKFSAFKLASKDGGVATSPVRMSFATDRPFYPYREPADQRAEAASEGRGLRVFFFSKGRMDGTLGETGDWPGRTTYAHELTAEQVGTHWPTDLLGESAYLTAFIDEANPRPGTADVWFSRSEEGDFHETVVHNEYEPVPLPLGALILAGGLAYWLLRRRRRP